MNDRNYHKLENLLSSTEASLDFFIKKIIYYFALSAIIVMIFFYYHKSIDLYNVKILNNLESKEAKYHFKLFINKIENPDYKNNFFQIYKIDTFDKFTKKLNNYNKLIINFKKIENINNTIVLDDKTKNQIIKFNLKFSKFESEKTKETERNFKIKSTLKENEIKKLLDYYFQKANNEILLLEIKNRVNFGYLGLACLSDFIIELKRTKILSNMPQNIPVFCEKFILTKEKAKEILIDQTNNSVISNSDKVYKIIFLKKENDILHYIKLFIFSNLFFLTITIFVFQVLSFREYKS